MNRGDRLIYLAFVLIVTTELLRTGQRYYQCPSLYLAKIIHKCVGIAT
jgi:hypothetical protein